MFNLTCEPFPDHSGQLSVQKLRQHLLSLQYQEAENTLDHTTAIGSNINLAEQFFWHQGWELRADWAIFELKHYLFQHQSRDFITVKYLPVEKEPPFPLLSLLMYFSIFGVS